MLPHNRLGVRRRESEAVRFQFRRLPAGPRRLAPLKKVDRLLNTPATAKLLPATLATGALKLAPCGAEIHPILPGIVYRPGLADDVHFYLSRILYSLFSSCLITQTEQVRPAALTLCPLRQRARGALRL